MTDRDLLKQALEALEHAMRYWDYRHITAALRERLAHLDAIEAKLKEKNA